MFVNFVKLAVFSVFVAFAKRLLRRYVVLKQMEREKAMKKGQEDRDPRYF